MDQARIFEQTEKLENAVVGMFSSTGQIDRAAHQRALAEVRRLLVLLNPPATRHTNPRPRSTNPAFLFPGGITYGGQAGVGMVAGALASSFGNPPPSAKKRSKKGRKLARCCGKIAKKVGEGAGLGIYRCTGGCKALLSTKRMGLTKSTKKLVAKLMREHAKR